MEMYTISPSPAVESKIEVWQFTTYIDNQLKLEVVYIQNARNLDELEYFYISIRNHWDRTNIK